LAITFTAGSGVSTFTAPSVRFQNDQTPLSAPYAASAPRKRWIRFLHVLLAAPHSEAEGCFPFLAVRQIECDLDRAARVQSRADPAGKALAFERGGLREAAVPADELLAISGDRAGGIVHVEEHDAVGKLGVVQIPGEQGAGLEVHFGRTWSRLFCRRSPSTHSQNPVTDSRRGRPETFFSFNTMNFTEASIAT
jgi:hypothetical protein